MNFSTTNIIAGIVFGSIGFVAFVYGKKMGYFKMMMIGLALMVYPYLVQSTTLVVVIGIALTGALYFFKD